MKLISFFFMVVSSCELVAQNQFCDPEPIVSSPDVIWQNIEEWMPTVTIDEPGNPPDTLQGSHGSIPYLFSIGKCDVTAQQYCDFLNAVAAINDPYHLYDSRMGTDLSIKCILREDAEGGGYQYKIFEERGNLPITYVDIYCAARFCNWMHHGCPIGLEAVNSTEDGAYILRGAMKGPIIREPGAKWFLPNEDEWYKSAYYKRGGNLGYYRYPNSSNTAPTNYRSHQSNNEANYNCYNKEPFTEELKITEVSLYQHSKSPYGLFDAGGNVDQWTETKLEENKVGINYVVRGGSWKSEYFWITSNELESSSRRFFEGSMKSNTLGMRVANSYIKANMLELSYQDSETSSWIESFKTMALVLFTLRYAYPNDREPRVPIETSNQSLASAQLSVESSTALPLNEHYVDQAKIEEHIPKDPHGGYFDGHFLVPATYWHFDEKVCEEYIAKELKECSSQKQKALFLLRSLDEIECQKDAIAPENIKLFSARLYQEWQPMLKEIEDKESDIKRLYQLWINRVKEHQGITVEELEQTLELPEKVSIINSPLLILASSLQDESNLVISSIDSSSIEDGSGNINFEDDAVIIIISPGQRLRSPTGVVNIGEEASTERLSGVSYTTSEYTKKVLRRLKSALTSSDK